MKRLMTVFLLALVCLAVGLDGGGVITAPEAAGGFKLPDYEKYVMENGLTVYFLEQHEVPLVYISAVFPAGAINDGDAHGLASLTAEGLLFGTKNYTKKEIEDQLDFIGASYNTYASKEYAKISMSFVNTDGAKVFPILKDMITQPIFDQEEFDKRKKRLLVELERAKESPRQVIRTYFDKFLFADHPYGNPTSGTRESVVGITVDDLKNFYKKNYYPTGSAIAIAGDFNTKKMKNEIKTLFRDWNTKGAPKSTAEASVPAPGKSKLLLVNKDDATETRFYIGSHGIKRSNPDYVAIQVVNTILGGRFTSWLNDELRINRGLTYGARSGFSEHKYSGTFTIRTFTKTATTVEAIDVALEIMEKLHKQGIDEETLASAKNYINGQFPPDYETAGELANLLTEMFVYDFDESFINNFQKAVDDMTVEKSRDIVSKYFPKDNLQFVLIGKADEIRDDVAKYGEISEKQIKDVGF